jgi:short subunit dehydrogenase-like uncharacterized protein
MKEIWILGATGRIGRAVARRLSADGQSIVLVGRDATRLSHLAQQLNGHVAIKVIATVSEIAASISRNRPAMVLNTVGPFIHTALPIVRACPPGTHYVDLSNEFPSVKAILGLQGHASQAGSISVTGAGFGVLATESVVLKLCEGLPPANRVRCAAIPAVAAEPGRLGESFASSITEGLALGGGRYEGGKFVRTSLMGDFERVTLPDGRIIGTASAPSGELETAQRASGASFAVSTTSMAPSSALLRILLPAMLSALKTGWIRRIATQRIAAIEPKQKVQTAPLVSWSHARVEWSSGAKRQGWLRTGDAMMFTADVMARVAIRIMKGDGTPGAYTPGALFGPELATECGGEIILDLSGNRRDATRSENPA